MAALLLHWSEHLIEWQVSAHSPLQGAVLDTKDLRPLDKLVRFTAPLYAAKASLISALLALRSPSAVAGRIWAVIVDAVDAGSGRTRSHVSQELGEVVSPLAAHDDSASSVVVECRILAVVAALDNRAPDFVLRTFNLADGVSVGQSFEAGDFASPAAATCTQSGSQVIGGYQTFGAAVASTHPVRAPFGEHNVESRPATEPLSFQLQDAIEVALRQSHLPILPRYYAAVVS